MQEIPPPWGEYARLQALSARISTVDSTSWGIEEEMDSFLENPAASTSADVRSRERIRETAARRERSRTQLRKVYQAELEPDAHSPVAQLEAREAIRQLEAKATAAQQVLVEQLGQGYGSAEIALERGIHPGIVRAQIFRLRNQFAELRPTA